MASSRRTYTYCGMQEEKARHAQLYPDYRFRPKHKANRGFASSRPTEIFQPLLCSKCGGRTIIGGGSPLTSPLGFVTSPDPESTGNEGIRTNQYMPQVANLSLSSPRAGDFGPSYTQMTSMLQEGMQDLKYRRFSPYPAGFSPRGNNTIVSNEVGRPWTGDLDHRRAHSNSVTDVDASRRRSLPYGHQQPPHSATQPSRTPTTLNSPLTSTHAPNGISTRLAPIMGPPPPARNGKATSRPGIPPTPPSARLPPAPRRATLTTDVRLPPLQTGPPSAPADLPAQVMSLNTVAKIKLLRTVAAPLGGAARSWSGPRHRGAIVALEGEDRGALDALCNGLRRLLARDFDVRVVPGPRDPCRPVGFADYMAVVSEWHGKRAEMVRFLTGEVVSEGEEMDVESDGEKRAGRESGSEDAARRDSVFRSSEVQSKSRGYDSDGDIEVEDSTVSPKRTATSPPAISPSPLDAGDRQAAGGKIPLLVIPHYTLHTSNVWASALPINDTYSPADHWQWVATLWRGIVGPDFTVYVRSSEDPPDTAAPPGFSRPAVEIREDLGTFIVKGGGKVEEGSVRRVAFELGEWARPGGVV